MGKQILMTGIGIILIIGIFFLINSESEYQYPNIKNYNEEITIYKGGSCGCCNVYIDYFKGKGNPDVAVSTGGDKIKQKYNIPASMESCHTTIVGNYFVEGHVPLEAFEKLIIEKPDILGIAIPGMPEGSPGMTGTKKGLFKVYQINKDGSVSEFMQV